MNLKLFWLQVFCAETSAPRGFASTSIYSKILTFKTCTGLLIYVIHSLGDACLDFEFFFPFSAFRV